MVGHISAIKDGLRRPGATSSVERCPAGRAAEPLLLATLQPASEQPAALAVHQEDAAPACLSVRALERESLAEPQTAAVPKMPTPLTGSARVAAS